jgi:hypothetical protein
MSQMSVVVGGLLVVLGVACYVMTGMVSVTALIPAFFGVVIAACGVLGRAEARRKTMMHAAMGVALLGILGSFSGFIAVARGLMAGEPLGAAAISRSLMAGLLIAYLVMGVRSFIAARRR